MSRENHAREGAQAAIQNDEIIDAALVSPKGSVFAGILGAAAGEALTGSAGWSVAGSVLAERASADVHDSYATFVLALSESRVYLLGRKTTALIGGWKHLVPVASIDRSHLTIGRHYRGPILAIALTDTTTGTVSEFEARPVGNLGVRELLKSLET